MLSVKRHFNTEEWTHSQFTDLIFLNPLQYFNSYQSAVKQLKRYSNEAVAVNWSRLLHKWKLVFSSNRLLVLRIHIKENFTYKSSTIFAVNWFRNTFKDARIIESESKTKRLRLTQTKVPTEDTVCPSHFPMSLNMTEKYSLYINCD